MTGAQQRQERVLTIVTALCTMAAVVFLIVGSRDPYRMNWGDPWSDANVQASGKFFARDGFIKNAFTPRVDIDPLGPDTLIYTHYPPLPDLLNGFEQRILGPSDISTYRIFALLLSFGALFFLYRFVKELWGGVTAKFAVPLFATNFLFLQYADTIHHIPIYWFAGFGAVYAGTVWLRTGKRWPLFGVLAGMFFCFMASYDYYFFIPILLVASVVVTKNRVFGGRGLKLLLVGAAGGALAIATKILLVIWAVGFREFIDDIIFQFKERATSQYGGEFQDGFLPILLGRSWRFFGPLLFVTLGAHFVALADRWRHRSPSVPASPVFVLVGAIPFLALFPQLFCEQYHPTLAILPYFAIGTGSVLAAVWERRGAVGRWTSVAALVFVALWQAREVSKFEKTFLARNDIAQIKDALDKNDQRRFVVTNAMLDAPFRYYWNRYPIPLPVGDPLGTLRTLFEKYGGDEPIYYVELPDVEKTAFDKFLYGLFGWQRRWDWIANPYAHKRDWMESIQEGDRQVRAALAEVSTVVVDTGTAQVRSVSYADVRREFEKELPPEETLEIDFESHRADPYKLVGWGPAEKYDAEPGFSWMIERQRSMKLIFTLKGLKDVPSDAPFRTAVLRVRVPSGHPLKIVGTGWAAYDGINLSLRVNGSEPVGQLVADSPRGPREYAFDVPANLLHDDGVQELSFDFTGADKWGHGVAFRTLRIEKQLPR